MAGPLTQARMVKEARIKFKQFPLSAGETAFRGGIACLDTSAGEVVPGQASTSLLHIGVFDEDFDNSAGSDPVLVNVNLDREIVLRYFDNDGSDPVASSDVGSDCYIVDDHTVSISSATSSRSKAGRVWDVDAIRGVGVEALSGSL